MPHTARHTYLFTQHKIPSAILKVFNYGSSIFCRNNTLNKANLQDSRKHSEAFTSILAHAPENRNHLEIFIMFLQLLAKVGPQPLIENARKSQHKSWALLLNALLGTFCSRNSLPLWDSLFIFKYVLQNIIVQGTVIYTYRLVVHLRKILTKQPTAFPGCICQPGKRLPPCGLHPRQNCKPSPNTELLKILFLRKWGYFLGFSPSIW